MDWTVTLFGDLHVGDVCGFAHPKTREWNERTVEKVDGDWVHVGNASFRKVDLIAPHFDVVLRDGARVFQRGSDES